MRADVQKVVEVCAAENGKADTQWPTVKYTLVLRSVKTWPHSPEQRLRAALKALLRGYGLECVEAKESQ